MYAALALDLNTGLRDKELREIKWEQVDLVHKKALTVGRSKTDAGTGRVIPLNETALAALQSHASWYVERFKACKPEWYVFAYGTPLPNDPTALSRPSKPPGARCARRRESRAVGMIIGIPWLRSWLSLELAMT